MIELTDESEMPFGKHKGIRMQDVPASYLFWLWDNGLKNETKTNSVAEYIQRNMSALKQECPDRI